MTRAPDPTSYLTSEYFNNWLSMHPEETQVLVFISQPDVDDTVAQKYMETYHSKSGLKYFIAKGWFARSVLEKQGYTVNLPEARDLVEELPATTFEGVVVFSYDTKTRLFKRATPIKKTKCVIYW